MERDRVLATVLFTDIVDFTTRAAAMGDDQWRSVLRAHDDLVREELARHRGTEIKRTGDGFLAVFEAPARAIRCARAIADAMPGIGLSIRAGLHTGEVHMVGGDIEGISVHIASRVADTAGRDQVVVSRTVRDLIAGSGIELEPFGTHRLKGVADDWELFRAVP